jgi:hypothetical protein
MHDPPRFFCSCGKTFVLHGDYNQHVKRAKHDH